MGLWARLKSVVSAVLNVLWENKVPLGAAVIASMSGTERASLVGYFAEQSLERITHAVTPSTAISLFGMAASSYVLIRTRYQPVKNILSGVSNNPDKTTYSMLTNGQKKIALVFISIGMYSMSLTFIATHEAFINLLKNLAYFLNLTGPPNGFSWGEDYIYVIATSPFLATVITTVSGYGINFFISNVYAAAKFMTSSEVRSEMLNGVSPYALIVLMLCGSLYVLPAGGWAFQTYSAMFKAVFNIENKYVVGASVAASVVSNELTFPAQGFRLLGKTQKDFSEWYGSNTGQRMVFFGKATVLAIDTATVSIANYGDFYVLTTSMGLAMLMAGTGGFYHLIFNLPLFNRPRPDVLPLEHTRSPEGDEEDDMERGIGLRFD